VKFNLDAECSTQDKKKFAWRVCHGCFPTRARLSSRGVHCLIGCVLCALECSGDVQSWHDVHLWDTIDITLRQNYNMDAQKIFSSSAITIGSK